MATFSATHNLFGIFDICGRNFGKMATPSLMVCESWRRAFNTTEFTSIVISAQSEG
jgi:hypothetical protein